MNRSRIIVLAGPTAVGKTAFAIELARAVGAEIIGADSMQIYRYMDIGTAKPTAEERQAAAHHMIDIRDPDERFDAAQYAVEARRAAAAIAERGRVPLVVGGTGLYIKALLGGLFETRGGGGDIREGLRREAAADGLDALYERLRARDPDTAARVHPHDAYRILRALEVVEATGQPISRLQHRHAFGDAPFRVLTFGLSLPRDRLYDRINHRVDAMMAGGFVEEVRGLIAMGYPSTLKSMQSIGYRHVCDVLERRFSLSDATALMKRDTRRYAKRQMTWFRADPQLKWVTSADISQTVEITQQFLG